MSHILENQSLGETFDSRLNDTQPKTDVFKPLFASYNIMKPLQGEYAHIGSSSYSITDKVSGPGFSYTPPLSKRILVYFLPASRSTMGYYYPDYAY